MPLWILKNILISRFSWVREARTLFLSRRAFDQPVFIKPIRKAACLLIIYSTGSHGAPVESWYQKVWCSGMGGQLEFRLKDGRRIDCLTETHAIEVEFAHNWPEAVGQSLDYSMLTGRKAGIVLILTRPTDDQHWQRLNKLINHYQLPVTLWKLGP